MRETTPAQTLQLEQPRTTLQMGSNKKDVS